MTEQAQAAAAASTGKDMLPGMLTPVNVKELRDGKFLAELQHALNKTVEELNRFYENTGDKRGKAKIKIVLDIGMVPGTDDTAQIHDQISRVLPQAKRSSTYPFKSGRIMVPATKEVVKGRNPEEPVMLFDFMGVARGEVDPATGKMIEDGATVGRIGSAS